VFTASRAEPLECQVIRSRGREFGITVPKATLVTRHALADGRTLLAVNVHALNFEHGTPKRFARQLQALRTVMDGHAGPLILAGDFNTWNPARDDFLRELTESVGLREVAGFTGTRKTGDQGSAVWNGILGIDPSLPLDRIFYRELVVSSARVLTLDSSDHPPLLVTFQCQPRRKGDS
jgi:endonuclease/exonuclease/phosphatase (EEP) superfamily protein YafD